MYREIIIDQWKNLYSDFAKEYEILRNRGNETASFNRWYEARIHRWNSITYSEGIILEQENNPDFSRELLKVLKGFKFRNVEPEKEKPMWIGIVAGVIAGVAVSAILTFLGWGKIKAVISGAVLLVVIIAAFSKENADYKNQEDKRVKEEYIQQLRGHQKEIIAVCDKYHM